MPFTVGGGINSVADIRKLLLAGAEKVSLNTAAVKKPKLIEQASEHFGSQCIVVAIDARAVNSRLPIANGGNEKPSAISHQPSAKKWEVYINGGRTPTGLDVVKWAKKAVSLGAGEILLTSMGRDGTKDGFDLKLINAVCEAVNVPVIASGGAGSAADFLEVFTKTKATAGLAASIFHYREIKVGQIKRYLRKRGVSVRL
jgi:imidazole glycerol-phosphate synthase subunit HisF